MIKRTRTPLHLKRHVVVWHAVLIIAVLAAFIAGGVYRIFVPLGLLAALVLDVYLLLRKPFQVQRNPTTMFSIKSPIVKKMPETIKTPRYTVNVSVLGTAYRTHALSGFEKTIDTILDQYIETAHVQTHAYTVAIFFPHPDGGFKTRRFKSESDVFDADAALMPGMGIIGTFLKNDMQPVYLHDFAADSTTLRYYAKDAGIRSLALFPIRDENTKRGFMAVDSREADHFTEAMRGFLGSMAALCGRSVSYAYLYNQHRLDYERLTAMSTIEKELFEQNDRDTVLDKLITLIPFAFQCDRLSICLFDKESGSGRVCRAWGRHSDHLHAIVFSLNEKSIAAIVHTNNLSLCREFSQEYYETRFTTAEPHVDVFTSFIALPLGFNECKGAVLLEFLNRTALSDTSRELLSRMIAAAGIVMEKIELVEQTEDIAVHDELTGLYNRHYFQRLLRETTARSIHRKVPFALVVMDIDHFKTINDSHGHQVGDTVLQKIAGLLAENIQPDRDTAARFGGEEFAVIVAESDQASVVRMVEAIRKKIEGFPFQTPSGERFTCTASFGVALSGIHAKDREQLIIRADKALYRAKHNGRNRVEVAAPITTHIGTVGGEERADN